MAFEHLQHLSAPGTADRFASAMTSLATDAGADHFLAARLRGVNLTDVVQVIHNAPAPEMVQGMRHWSLVRLLDTMRSTPLPVVFGNGGAPAPEVPGFASGVSAMASEPRGAVIIVLGCQGRALSVEQTMPLVQTALLAAHHSIAGLRQLHAAACPLSERELECLQLAFTGELSSREIGQRLNISARTVEHYLESARARFGVDSTIAAGVHAVNQGWMDLLNSGPIEITG